MKRFEFNFYIYVYLFFTLLLFSCSKNEGDLKEPKYLMTEFNSHDEITDAITYVHEYVYDSDDKLILIKRFSQKNLIGIELEYFNYNELNELTSFRDESGSTLSREYQVTKENGKISVKGWDDPQEICFYYNENNIITVKEVRYSSSTNIFNFTHNNKNQLVKIKINVGDLAPTIITYDNFINSNSNPFYISVIGNLDFIITHAFNLKFSENGTPSTVHEYSNIVNIEYNIDKNENISKMYYSTNNVFSFKYKRAD